MTRQTQVEHPLAARYGQLLSNFANETSSNGNASNSSSSTLTGGGGSSLVAVVAAQQQPIVYQNSSTRVIQPQFSTAIMPTGTTATVFNNNNSQTFQQQHIYANANHERVLEQTQQLQQQQQVTGNGSGSGGSDHVYSNMTEALMQMQQHAPASTNTLSSSDNLSSIYGNIGCNRSILLDENGDMNCVDTGPHYARALPMPIRSGRASECLVPANPYLNEKIPDWLIIYSKASQEHDHKLKVRVNST